jgi:hypothetical protein
MRRSFSFSRSSFSLALSTSALVAAAAPLRAQCFPSWRPVGTGLNGDVIALVAFDEDGPGPNPAAIFAGGSFTAAGATPVSRVARWNGTSWSPLGSGVDNVVHALAVFDEDGPGPLPPRLFAAGEFLNAGGAPASHVARWDGVAWAPLGAGFDLSARCLATFDPDGPGPANPVLVAGGTVTLAGGGPANRIARRDGSTWTNFANGHTGPVLSLAVFDDDGGGPLVPRQYAGGVFAGGGLNRIARWTGTSWVGVGAGSANPIRSSAQISAESPRSASVP